MDRSKVAMAMFGLIWLVLISIGFVALMKYEHTPGVPAVVGPTWPANSYMDLMKSGATLVMFVHPHCPCSRASIVELSKIMTGHRDKLSGYVVFLSPSSFPDGWEKTDIWQDAQAISGVKVLKDIDGRAAEKFGSQTSGQTMVYDPQGNLLYCGGITSARGQIGDSTGAKALEMALDRQLVQPSRAMVFGCALTNR